MSYDLSDMHSYLKPEEPSRPQSSEWRDISSAPKDGTRVLIFALHPPNWAECKIVYYEPGGISDCYPWKTEEGDTSYKWDWPTHWQPLPAPPEGESK